MEKSHRGLPLIPVIIPHYKAKEKLSKCLEHLKKTTLKIEPCVIDNSEDNRLYTKAINEGLKKYLDNIFVKYFLILTEDVYLDQNCLERLFEFMNKKETCGIATPLQHASGKITYGGASRAWPGGQHVHLNVTEPHLSYWANGACMLVRKKMVQEIGILDENMKFVCSDSDYSFTARSRGWEIYVVPEASCEHELGGSGSFGKNQFLDKIKLQDFTYFTEKWLSGGLYKKMAFEGEELTQTKIKAQLKEWENHYKQLVNLAT